MAFQGSEGVAVSIVSFNDSCEIFFVKTKVLVYFSFLNGIMSSSGEFGNPLRKFKLVFLGEQSGKLEDKLTLRNLMSCQSLGTELRVYRCMCNTIIYAYVLVCMELPVTHRFVIVQVFAIV